MKQRREYDIRVIGENLRRLRLEKSLSVEEVREYLKLGSVQAVYKYERGEGLPQTDTMFALMELYDAKLEDIINKHISLKFSFDIDNNTKMNVRLIMYYENIKHGMD